MQRVQSITSWKCEWGSFKCFYCKENVHKAIDCQKRKAPIVGRAYVMNAEEVEEEADTTLITDLIVLFMPEFDIIIGMDWLSANGSSIYFRLRSVTIRPPSGKSCIFEAARNKQMPHIISCLCSRRLIKHGCQAFLACVTTAHAPISQKLEDVDNVREFPCVFPEDVSGIPPDREVELSIDLMPDFRMYVDV
ncbi:uncharacterized protein [Primulina eburnea]|uniref:uncharacterized protein n=1 Tax=Primulina eburnea TaxID=1245227 RepID=UPI003C6C6A21